MENLRNILEKYINKEMTGVTLSNVKAGEITKVKIRPILLKGNIMYQETRYIKEKVFHENYEKQEIISVILKCMADNFKQMELKTPDTNVTVLVSKKGKVTIKEKKISQRENQLCENRSEQLEHNRRKKYILNPENKIDFLVDLGVMTNKGKIINSHYDKFRQINRFLEYIDDVAGEFKENEEIKIIDFGCGKSYLTFAVYYYFTEIKKQKIKMIGLDLKEDVIKKCNQLSQKYGYENLKFYVGDIAGFDKTKNVDMVITLHACDTATDYALEKAVKWGAKVIMSVPCCQHELNKQIKNDILEPILKYGLIKERMSALITDAIRANILEMNGYQVDIMEFIDMEHTPKNIMIRGILKGNTKAKNGEAYTKARDFLHASPMLDSLLYKNQEK